MSFLRDILCKLGLHDWSSKIFHEEAGTFVKHSEKVCRNCGAKRSGSEKEDWDKSK